MKLHRPLYQLILLGLLCTLVAGTPFSRPLSVQAETITAYTTDSPVKKIHSSLTSALVTI